ncbi:MAG: hydroxyacid dehydrogenase [Sphaerochaetaceae bacterium]
MKVYIGQDVSVSGPEFLLKKGYEVIMASKADPLIWMKEIGDADAFFSRGTIGCPGCVFDVDNNLKVIGNYGVGTDKLDVMRATELGIWVTNTPIANTVSVAEHTIALILALASDLLELDRETREGNWEIRNSGLSTELYGKTLGIIGYGAIGRKVAAYSMSLGMKILIYSRHPEAVEKWEVSLDEIFSQSDFITLHVPLTSQTYHMVGARELSLMKKSAFLINCARGGIVDDCELYKSLLQKKIAGAALDCLEDEPATANCPLFRLDNVIVDPHTAGQTREAGERMSLHAAMGIDDVLQGRKPQWSVNHPEHLRQSLS